MFILICSSNIIQSTDKNVDYLKTIKIDIHVFWKETLHLNTYLYMFVGYMCVYLYSI